MTVLRRSATGAVAAFAVVLAMPTVSAEAAAKPLRFETLATVSDGKVQACRIPTRATQPIKIKVRVNARKAQSRVSGIGQATYKENPVGKAWESGWIKRGKRSSVGTVRVPRGAAYGFMAGIGAGEMGDGGVFRPADIRRCR